MKISIFYFSILFFLISIASFAQQPEVFGGEFKFNPENKACITPQQREEILGTVEEATKKFREKNAEQKTMSQLFEWPIQKASNSPYFESWAISNFVDHNTGFPEQTIDYNCGNRTYDTNDGYNHQGTDIYTWPFSWDQFYNNQAEVIAAAPGNIIYKADGNFDQNCSFNSSNWNTIYIQHTDGSIALYGHMKSNTLTSKGVGQSVSTGEFLGVIGSSGNSTGPHLHFEIFDNNDNLIDPFTGNCNSLNNTSWWNNQMNYREPNINALLTSSSAPSFNSCPQPATINQQYDFEYGETAYFSIYLRDQLPGMSIDFKLTSPSGAIRTPNNTYSAAYWYSSFPINTNLFPETGVWTYEATFNNQTESIEFYVGDLSVINSNAIDVTAYPNPFDQQIHISTSNSLQRIKIYDIHGKLLISNSALENETSISTSHLQSGVYFLKITDTHDQTSIKRMLKK